MIPHAALRVGALCAALLAGPAAAPLAAQTFEISPPATEAARLFQKVCGLNAGRLSQAGPTLERMGFIHGPDDDLYYHPTWDLSFSIRRQDGSDAWYCSMVWSSADAVAANQAAIAAVAPGAERPEMSDSDLMRTRLFGRW